MYARVYERIMVKKRNYFSLILITLIAIMLAFIVIPQAETTAKAEEQDSYYVQQIDFSVSATSSGVEISEGVTQNSAVLFTLDAGSGSNGNVKFYYYSSDKSNLDATKVTGWSSVKKNDGATSTTLTIDGTYDQTAYFYFKSTVTYSIGGESVTYTYYYSKTSSYVYGKTIGINGTENDYYTNGTETASFSSVNPDHLATLSSYETRISLPANPISGVITAVSAKYDSQDGEKVYPTDSANVFYTGSDITFTLTSSDIANTSYQYSLVNSTGETAWANINGNVFTLNKTSVGSTLFDGTIKFRAYNKDGVLCSDGEGTEVFGDQDATMRAGTADEYKESIIYVKWSTATPDFGVSATYIDPITKETKSYVQAYNVYAPANVTYTLSLGEALFSQDVVFHWYDGTISGSGNSVNYSGGNGGVIGRYDFATSTYYNSEGVVVYKYIGDKWYDDKDTVVNNPGVSWTLSQSKQVLRFFATTPSGNSYRYPQSFLTNIDKVTPTAVVTMRDGKGTEFVVSQSGKIFAEDSLTFTVNNKEVMTSAEYTEYQYKTSIDGEWTKIDPSTTDGNTLYSVTKYASGDNEFFDGTYYFRIKSAAGLYSDEVGITFSIDSSQFFFSTSKDNTSIDYDMSKEWAKQNPVKDENGTEIKTYAVEDGLRIAMEVKVKDIYSFYYTVLGRAGETLMEIDETEEVELLSNGSYRYVCILKDSVKDGVFTFYAKNRAGVKSATTITLNDPISIDSYPASVKVEGFMNENLVSTTTDGSLISSAYVNGKVNIILSPVESLGGRENNVSGFKVYRLYGENRVEKTASDNGTYVWEDCSSTEDYVFLMATGAGVESTITYRLNIESADLSIENIRYSIESEDGNFGEIEDIATLKTKDVATKIRFYFDKNADHVAPFNILYRTDTTSAYTVLQESSEDGIYEMDLSKLKDDGSFDFDTQGYSYQGRNKFTFYFKIESVSTASDGTKKSSAEKLVEISVNREVANLSVARKDSTAGWHKGIVEIILANTKDFDAKSFIYQVSFVVKGGTPETWNDLDMTQCDKTVQHSGDIDFYAYTYTLKSNFNGTLYFRALNSAGYVGATVSTKINLTYDNTTPDVLRSIYVGTTDSAHTAYDIKVGEGKDLTLGTVEEEVAQTTVYVSDNVVLKAPVDSETCQFAPTLFFVYMSEGIPTVAPTVTTDSDGNLIASNTSGWRNLNEVSSSIASTNTTRTLYMYADNGTNNSGIKTIKLVIDQEIPTIDVSYSPSAGAQDASGASSGVFIFHWAERNEVTLGSTSSTNVKYQVRFSDAWLDLTDNTWQTSGNTFSFAFDKTTLQSLVGKTSIQSTASFRVVAKTGAYKVSTVVVKLQIDTETPDFDLKIYSGDEEFQNTLPEDRWFSNALKFTIVPKDAEANPGGVTYTYEFQRDPDFTQGTTTSPSIIRSTTFTSNNIDGLVSQMTANGVVKSGFGKLTITATTKQGNRSVKREVNIKIDALMPEFNMTSYYTDEKGTKIEFASGSWVNTDKVIVEITDLGKTTDGSKVYENVKTPTLTYLYSTNGSGKYIEYNGTLTITEKTRIYFKAVSMSGQVVEKIFDVNIDRQAPEIKTRIVEGGTYYVDERIAWLHDDDTIKVSTLNGMHFSNGDIVSVETINLFKYTTTNRTTDANYGLCKLYLEDMAGNVSTYTFYMKPFVLTVDNIEDTEKDRSILEDFRVAIKTASEEYRNGETLIYARPLTNARETYFNNLYDRLLKRLDVLQKEVVEFKNYLYTIAGKNANSFTLQGEYDNVSSHVLAYNGYAQWEKDAIITGDFVKNGTTYKYNSVNNILMDAYNILYRSMQVVESAEDAIALLPATMVVEVADYEEIMRVYNVYASLTADQKAVFKTRLYEKLAAVKSRCEELMLTTETGVKVEGEKLPEGVRLVAEDVNKSTDDYVSIQEKIFSATTSNDARSVVLVRKVYLSGENSTNPTGTMTMTIEIPEGEDDLGIEYRSYTVFAVYKYMSDGSVQKMSDTTIAPDGKSVSFTADSLGTYALVCNSSIKEKGEADKVYGYIGDIAVDSTMIVYIAIGAGVLFVILIVILIITGIRRRAFLQRYDEKYRYGLRAKGITRVPKGNKARARNPRNKKEYARPMPAGLKEGKPFDEKKIKKERKKKEKQQKEASKK